MEKYGCTIRKIRLSKGFSQKEIYTGILSKSFAIDFEKGLYDVKFSIMLEILRCLMISVDELLLIHNDYHDTAVNETLLYTSTEKFSRDLKYAEGIENKLCDEMEKDDDPASRLKYMQILALKSYYTKPGYEQSDEYRRAKQYIQKYLFDVESWTLSELRIFSDMGFLFDGEDIKTELFQSAWRSAEKYKYHPEYGFYISHLLTNNLYHLIYSGQYLLAKKVIDRLHELTKDEVMVTWRVTLFYLEGIYYYATGERERGENEIEKALCIYRLTENIYMTEQINKGFQMIREKLGESR